MRAAPQFCPPDRLKARSAALAREAYCLHYRAFGRGNEFSDAVKAANIALLTSYVHEKLCLMRKNS